MKKTKRLVVWAVDAHDMTWAFVLQQDAQEKADEKRERGSDARVVRCVELPPGSVVVTREEARRPIASRLVVQNARLTAACATMETALELIADGEGDADALAQRALRATKARKT